jgi:4-hydroxy-tetrahydrodipicolinate synthase
MTFTPQLFVPAITPFAADLSVDRARFVTNCKVLLADGAHGLAPFGTTSEATSMSVAERMTALEALIASGVSSSQLIPGTGCAAITDSIALTRHAVEQGCLGVLMLPPFYYKPVTDQGVFDAFARIIEAVGDSRLKVYLYHIPQMTGVPITLTLIEMLLKAYPNVITGLKDSSGNWDNTHSVIKAFPQLRSFSASEAVLSKNVAAGGAGCISASANVQARNIVDLIGALGTAREDAVAARVTAVRKIFEGLPLIPSIKAATARRHKDDSYAIVRPPFVTLAAEHFAKVDEALALSAVEAAHA